MSVIKLTFRNQSNDRSGPRVLIYQKSTKTSYDTISTAWKVIQNCGQGDYHPFEYVYDVQVTAGDSWGNFTQPADGMLGDRFKVIKDTSGDVLVRDTQRAIVSTSVEVANDLEKGSISANIYRSGKLLARKMVVAPGQKAVFDFPPILHIGVVSEIEEGEPLDSAVMAQVNTELSLRGLASADIVMRGGGTGKNAVPFTFTLENVNYE